METQTHVASSNEGEIRQRVPSDAKRRAARLLIQGAIVSTLIAGGSGCGLAAPTHGEVLTSEGDTSPVAIATFERRVRHTDVLSIDVVFPANADGSPRKRQETQRWPGVVLIQGGRVDVARYHWLARALAQRGYVVALPEHPLDLAIFEVDNASVARDLLTFPPEGSLLQNLVDRNRVAVAGHSLGGVVAVKSVLSGGYAAVALLASHPDPSDGQVFTRSGYPTLLLAGERDCKATPAEIESASSGNVPRDNALVTVAGLSHDQFTDAPGDEGREACLPTISLETAHAKIVEILDVFLKQALLENGDSGAPELARLEGLTVEQLEGGGRE